MAELTDEQIEAAVTRAVKAGKLPWAGFKEDEDGQFTLPVLSRVHYGLVRLGIALSATGAEDAARLDWLEQQVNEHGAIHLHDGQHPAGHGLGLRPGAANRTLRWAIDQARGKSNGGGR